MIWIDYYMYRTVVVKIEAGCKRMGCWDLALPFGKGFEKGSLVNVCLFTTDLNDLEGFKKNVEFFIDAFLDPETCNTDKLALNIFNDGETMYIGSNVEDWSE